MKVYRVFVLTLILILCQIADGLLTYLGVETFGTHAEGNPIIRFLIHEIGAFHALLFAKLFAVCLIVLMCVHAIRYEIYRLWVASMFRIMIAFYVIVAVCPWLVALYLSV